MESQRIEVTRDGGVAHVELARADKFNAMDHAMFAGIGETFRSLGTDSSVRCILLSGRGRHFTAGLDLQYAASQFPPSSDPGRSAESRLRHIRWLQDAFNAVEEARPPVVAAIHGGCIGAGVDLASSETWEQFIDNCLVAQSHWNKPGRKPRWALEMGGHCRTGLDRATAS